MKGILIQLQNLYRELDGKEKGGKGEEEAMNKITKAVKEMTLAHANHGKYIGVEEETMGDIGSHYCDNRGQWNKLKDAKGYKEFNDALFDFRGDEKSYGYIARCDAFGGRKRKRRRRRKGGQLSIESIVKLKGKMHQIRAGLKSHIKENITAKQQIAAGNSNVTENVTHLTHSDMQAMDAMMDTMVNYGPGAVQDTATFITMAGKKMISIGNNNANIVADFTATHGPGMVQKFHEGFMATLNKSGTHLTAAFDIVKDKAGKGVGWLNLHKPAPPDLTKATQYVKDIYDKLPTKEKIMGFVKVNGKTFSFSVDDTGVTKVKGIGSFIGKVGGYVKDKAGAVGDIGAPVAKAARNVGQAAIATGEVAGKFVMGGITIFGKTIKPLGSGLLWIVKGLGTIGSGFGKGLLEVLKLLGQGLSVLWPVLEFLGMIVGGVFGAIGAVVDVFSGHGGKRTKKKRRTKRRRKRTKKKRRKRTKKKRRRRRRKSRK